MNLIFITIFLSLSFFVYGNEDVHLAAREGRLEDLKQLVLREGTDIDAKEDKTGRTALHEAVLGEHQPVVEFIVELGADVNARDEKGETALHKAARVGNTEIANFLISKGVDVNVVRTTYRRETALPLAARKGYLEIVQILFPLADIDSKKKALQEAASKGRLEIVKFLIESKEFNKKAKSKALMSSAVDGDGQQLEVLKFLVSAGADVNFSTSYYGETVLHEAAQFGSLEMVRHLVLSGASVDERNRYYDTPLHIAASKGKLKIVKFLISKDANINAKDKKDRTPLHLAARGGNWLYAVPVVRKKHVEVVEFLIASGAKVNKKDKYEWMALHYAAEKGSVEMIEALVKGGADINAGVFSKFGFVITVLDVAVRNKHLDAANTLRRLGASTSGPLKFIAYKRLQSQASSQGHTSCQTAFR